MNIYDNVILKDGQFFDGDEYLGCLVDESFCEFRGRGFTFSNLKELKIKIRLDFCEIIKIEISRERLNEILGRGTTLDIYEKRYIREKELINLSVKFGTNSQTLITEWI